MAENLDDQNNTAAAEAKTGDQEAGGKSDSKATLLTDKQEAGKPAEGDKSKEGEQKPAEGDKSKDDKAKEGAPEKYEFAAPEGVQLDQELLGKFSTLAKELNLPQANAQKVVDLGVEMQKTILQKQAEQWAEIRQGWITNLKADKDFGGQKFNETIEGAKRALSTFGDPEMVEFLESTGFGDHAGLIKFLAKVDKKTREDSLVDKGTGKGDVSAAEILYPEQGKK